MSTPPMSKDLMREAVTAFREHKTKSAAALALGIPRSTLRSRLAAAEMVGVDPDAPKEERGESWRFTETDEAAVFEGRVDTVADAWRKSGLDRALWEVEKVVVNGWEGPVTMGQGP